MTQWLKHDSITQIHCNINARTWVPIHLKGNYRDYASHKILHIVISQSVIAVPLETDTAKRQLWNDRWKWTTGVILNKGMGLIFLRKENEDNVLYNSCLLQILWGPYPNGIYFTWLLAGRCQKTRFSYHQSMHVFKAVTIAILVIMINHLHAESKERITWKFPSSLPMYSCTCCTGRKHCWVHCSSVCFPETLFE